LNSPPRIVAIVGPTATGKTQVAIDLARETRGEVVSVDSMLLYRGMDIGTAKPPAEERQGVPHHMIDVADPDDSYDAQRYATEAARAIEDIRGRDRPAVLVGGTGLYLRVLLHGLAPAPGANPELRAELRALAERDGRAAVHARLAAVDPAAAARISPNDLVRMERALEAAAQGIRLSALQAEHHFGERRYDALILALDLPGPELAARIEARTRRMFEIGFVEEVQGLVARYGSGLRALGAVGYREVTAMLQGNLSHSETMEEISRATRRYAKRQRTWLRSEAGVEWVPAAEIPWNRMRAHLFSES
jgi:tRNA dimethylallyltransferase